MTIELPREIESRLKESAEAQGVSVSQYVEKLVAEGQLRQAQIADLRAAIADGEEVMFRLIADPAAR
jgi:predicted transcriptional regulator